MNNKYDILKDIIHPLDVMNQYDNTTILMGVKWFADIFLESEFSGSSTSEYRSRQYQFAKLLVDTFNEKYFGIINDADFWKNGLTRHISQTFNRNMVNIIGIKEEMESVIDKKSIEFAKWLQHLDNGTTHYNPHTKERTDSIGFSPYDCFVEETKTVEELYQEFLKNK